MRLRIEKSDNPKRPFRVVSDVYSYGTYETREEAEKVMEMI